MDPWVVGSPVRIHKWRRPFMNKTLEFLFLFSFSFFLYSYFSGFPFFFSYNIQLSTIIFPFFARALDRKYMFLICNGILAFLAKNLNYSSSRLNYTGIIESDGDGLKQITKLQTVEENIASIEYAPKMTAAQEEEEEETEQDYGAKEMKVEGITLESEEWEDGEEEEDDEVELKESKDVEGSLLMEDASVSTEELNQKFEEFIRKMKEEIRIEAQ